MSLLFILPHLVWSKHTDPTVDRGGGDVVDEGPEVQSADLQVLVRDHLHHYHHHHHNQNLQGGPQQVPRFRICS